ncbi:hypothetical protein BD410DRAFT_794507 [Rickenella mellea]|uniref:PLP-dependent transferase n=1 Tax=Rickenella mellea TaxID=50990 RepID=A0A4Y7PPV9_9AGAM|nr:hypothetical protein BD410DRAFT_794507 [Rickenella mellea]
MDIEQFRKAGHQAIDRICDFNYSVEKMDVVSSVEPGYLRKALPSEPPEQGEDFSKIADDYQQLIVPGLTQWQHPSFFAYFPAACTFEGVLGDLYASSVTNPGFNWSSSPACTELEAIMTDWAAKLLGLDKAFLNSNETGGGVVQTSASDSVLTATVAARSLYSKLHPDVSQDKLLFYTTSQTHSVGAKAALILGIKVRSLEVNLSDNFGLRGETLRNALEEDIRAGLHPFIIVATIGTTSSGAIDHLNEICVVAQEYSLWMHVDAAWAGVTLSCPENREICHLSFVNRYVQSFCVNFHKWGLVNFDASILWVRNREYLTDALDVTPPFLRTAQSDAGTVIDYRNWHLGLGRRFRSLKFWFVLRSYGVEGFRQHIRKGIELNKLFSSWVSSSTLVELATSPSFGLTVLRMKAPKHPTASQDFLTRKLFECLSARKDIMVTQTVLQGIFCIRFAFGAERTEERHIVAAFNLLCDEARKVNEEFKIRNAEHDKVITVKSLRN